MTADNLVKLLQMTGATLAIPAAAAGTFAAYQSYFSSDVTCQKLRNDIVAIMERHVAPETKRSLLKKDVTEFDKLCGESDPDGACHFPSSHNPAGRNERSDQAAKQVADRCLRARARKSRRGRAAVGRGRSGIMLVNKGFARVRILDRS